MRYFKVKLSITTAMILIAGVAITSMPRVSAQREKHQSVDEQKLLDVAAQREGADGSQLQLHNSTTVELPLTGRKVRLAKIPDFFGRSTVLPDRAEAGVPQTFVE